MGIPIDPEQEKFFHLVEQARSSLNQTNQELSKYSWFQESEQQAPPEWAKQHVQVTLALEQSIRNLEKKPHLSTDLQAKLAEAKEIASNCRSSLNQVAQKIGQVAYVQILYPQRGRIDPHALLKGNNQTVENPLYEWHINLGLILDLYNETNDPVLKKTLSFLALNYLAKAAPINFRGVEHLTPSQRAQLEPMFQLGALTSPTYHREAKEYEKYMNGYLTANFSKSLQMSCFHTLMDTTEVTELFPLLFTVLQPSQDSHQKMEEKLDQHLSKYGREEGFQHFLEDPFLFDLTDVLGNDVLASSGKEGEERLAAKIEQVKQAVSLSIEKTVQEMKKKHPNLSEDDALKFREFLKANCCFTFRTKIHEFGVLSLIPVFNEFHLPEETTSFLGVKTSDSSKLTFLIRGNSYLRNQARLASDFPNVTGTRIGAITARKQVFNTVTLQEFMNQASQEGYRYHPTSYAVQGNKETMPFKTPSHFIHSNFFKSFAQEMNQLSPDSPHTGMMGRATTSLIEGLFQEIPPETWEKVHQDPVLTTLMQTTLMRMRNHLATAMDQRHDFSKFAQAIELVHAEIATVLEITKPFNNNSFEPIYRRALRDREIVPASMTVRCGVAKSAMNVIAGVNIAVLHQNGHLSRACADHSYFETLDLLGHESAMSQQKKSADPTEVNLYIGEFNHNIQLDPSFKLYEKVDVISDIEYLLEHKKTEHLTVAIDCTIDSFDSPKVKEVLQRFAPEVERGEINFIFLRSGQKFDMLGMDNYYGSPFYIVNNGAPHWEGFNAMVEKSTYQTDDLSAQWFCLASKYIPEEIDQYRKQIFSNAREILDHVPEELKPDWPDKQRARVNSSAPDVDSSFIDIKALDGDAVAKITTAFYEMAAQRGIKVHARASFGFYHANLNVIGGSIRINPGINPEENKFIIEFLQEIPKILAKETPS